MTTYRLVLTLLCSVLLSQFLTYAHAEDAPTETAAAATETAAATTESAEAATETPKPATIPEAAKNLGSAVQNSASQTLQKSKESLQRVRASGQQMANDFVHPQYDDTQKNIVHSAVSGTANLAREVTGHTGSLLGGIASTIMQFGKDIFASGSNTLSRTAQRIGRSRLLKPFIPSQPTNQANNVVPVEQPNELTNGQATEAEPQVAQTNAAVTESAEPIANTEEAKTEEVKTEEAKPEETKAEEAETDEPKADEAKPEEEAKAEEAKA